MNSDIGEAIRSVCGTNFGVLSGSFLCRSISALNPKMPVCVKEDTNLEQVLKTLKANKIGAVLVQAADDTVSGIFTERDCVLKVFAEVQDFKQAKVSDYMTKNPTCETCECSIAYALNLMSAGGFRHLPIVDKDRKPIGIISVKNMLDAISQSFLDDVMKYEDVSVETSKS